MKKNNGHISRGRYVPDYASAAIEQMELYCVAHPGSPSAVRRPRLSFRSELWIALLGPSIEEGIVGIGSTIAAALRAFDTQYLACIRPPVETVGSGRAARPSYRNSKSGLNSRKGASGLPGHLDRELPNDFGTTATTL